MASLSKRDRGLAQLAFALVVFVLVELRSGGVDEGLTSHHRHMDPTTVVALVRELPWQRMNWLIWSKTLKHRWLRNHRVVMVVHHRIVLNWHYLRLIS